MADAPTVAIVGLRALARDLRKLSKETAGPLVDALKQAGREAATPVANATRAAVPKESSALSSTARVSATRTGASVRYGTAKYPYAGWIEFGGVRRNPRLSRRPFVAGGRYLFPAAAAAGPSAARHYIEAVTAALEKFDWTNETTAAGSVHD